MLSLTALGALIAWFVKRAKRETPPEGTWKDATMDESAPADLPITH